MRSFLYLLICLVSSSVFASESLLVSVGTIRQNRTDEWNKKICSNIHSISESLSDRGFTTTCRKFNPRDPFMVLPSGLDKLNDWHLQIFEDPRGNQKLTLTKLKKEFDFDIGTVEINLEKNAEEKFNEALSKALFNFVLFIDQENALKAGLLANGSIESKTIIFDVASQSFKDRVTQKALSLKAALEKFSNESPRHKTFLKTGLELGAIMSAGMAVYYRFLVYNRQDFDYTLWNGLYNKLITGRGVKFDDNDKFANYGHVYAGMLYYQIARANDATSLESFLLTFASSALWEILEFHEVFSINDQVMTPIGGYVLGEVSHQLACALLEKSNLPSKLVAYGLNPGLAQAAAVSKFLGGKPQIPKDCHRQRWLQMSAFLGAGQSKKPFLPEKAEALVLGLDALVVNLDDYAKTGKSKKLIIDPTLAKLLVSYGKAEGLGDLKVIAEVIASAYRQKNLSEDENGDLKGYEFIIGPSLSSTWHDIGTAYTWKDFLATDTPDNEDFFGTVSLIGGSAHLNGFFKGYNVQADVSVYGDFTMVKAFALSPLMLNRSGNLSSENSLIQKRGYSYGLGSTGIASLLVSKNRFSMNYWYQNSQTSNLESRHRFEGSNPSTFSDAIKIHQLNLQYRVTKKFSLGVQQERLIRSGTANEFERSDKYSTTLGKVIFNF